MNCGFEDCTDLMKIFNDRGDRWDEAFGQFSRTRKTHTDAISDMAVENFIEMRDKVADPQFLLQKSVEKILQEKFPKDYIPRYQMVTFSRLPYRVAYEAGAIENEILAELCVNIKNASEVDLDLAERLISEKLKKYLHRPT